MTTIRIPTTLALVALLALGACHPTSNSEPIAEPSTDTVAPEVQTPLVEADPSHSAEASLPAQPSPRQFTPRPVTARPSQPKTVHRVVKAPQPKTEPETFYVETHGAQGMVWGHVTMNGDMGTGTIHDAGENTLTVSCTRHGNELYAVDQNSRRYVFKLKPKTSD